MARVLIVGCGCRGQALAAALVAEGYAVRGTTRDADRMEAIAAAGAEGVVADPNRLATLLPAIEGVSAICWLLATAAGDGRLVAALHDERLQSLLEHLVDTPVRGFVYEAGSPAEERTRRGAGLVLRAGETFRMPVAVVDRDPAGHGGWPAAMTGAVRQVLGAG